MYLIAAIYRFVHLDNLHVLQASLRDHCETRGIKGTLLIAEEGLNGTIAGPEDRLRGFLELLQQDPRMTGLSVKESWAETAPFRELKVRIKHEIVTMGVPGIDPRERVGEYVQPKDWNRLISDPDVTLIDTRNTYETDIGTFEGAVLPLTRGFREFPEWVRGQKSLDKKQKVAMFCTGGIRCEKATALLLKEGFSSVYHLKGGILKYLEEIPRDESLWNGDCFVFDERVSVDHDLSQADHVMCRACGRAVDAAGRADSAYRLGVSCAGCINETTEDQRLRFAEREKQIRLAKERDEPHLGATIHPKRSHQTPAVFDPDCPVLYSFRRCPYAMRARLALATSQQLCRLREVVLRDKPESLLEYSPKGTVPVLVLADGTVIDESLEIMYWALNQSDPNAWLTPETETLAEVTALIAWNDGEFKTHLDRYKYASRYEGADPLEHRSKCEPFLKELEQRLSKNSYLFGRRPCLADVGIAPFVRQFANVEKEWFAATPYPHLHEWLNQFVESEQFKRIMKKFKQWHAGDKVTLFPG